MRKKLKIFCKQHVKGNLHIFSFSRLKIRLFKILQNFLHIWIGIVKGFSKMYNFSFFGQVFFCKHLYYITGFCDKKFNFCKSANFLQILKVETRAFQWCIICHIWTSNMGFRASISWFSSTPAKIWLTLSRLS